MSKEKRIDLSDVSLLTTEDCEAIRKAAFFTPLSPVFAKNGGRMYGLPLIFDGPPGGGKSSSHYRFAMEWLRRTHPVTGKEYLAYASITIGAQGEGRFGVVPVPVAKEDGRVFLDFPPPADLAEAFPERIGLLNWDDLSTMPPALSAVALDGLQMRRIGTFYLGDRVRCFGATNNIEDAAGGWDVPPAVVNRAGWLMWPDHSPQRLGRYFMSEADSIDTNEIPKRSVEAEEERVEKAWGEHYARCSQLVAAFLHANPGMMRKQKKTIDSAAGRTAEPWASSRSWEAALRAMASARVHGLTSLQTNAFMASFIGQGPTNEFEDYVTKSDLPDPALFLDGKIPFTHSRIRLDRTFVVIESSLSLLKNPHCENRVNRAVNFWKFALTLVDECSDMLVGAVRQMWSDKLTASPEARAVLARMEPVVNASRTTA